MATITAAWAKNQTLGTDGTIAGNGSTTDTIDLSASGYDTVKIWIDVTLGSSSGVLAEFFSDDGTNTSTQAAPTFEITANGTYDVEIANVPGVDVKLTNQDASNATGTITRRYAGRTWSST